MRHGNQAVMLLLGMLFSVAGWGQNWPVKPVRVLKSICRII